LFSALALFALPFFFTYLEVERLSGWVEATCRPLDVWLPVVEISVTLLVVFVVPWMVDWFCGLLLSGPSKSQP
jgi:hypothetical protein